MDTAIASTTTTTLLPPPTSTGSTEMRATVASSPQNNRSPSPDGSQDYDVTRMREKDFERLAVYIVPDVQCERGVPNRAEKTLPRSLTLKPSLVLSTPNVKVILLFFLFIFLSLVFKKKIFFIIISIFFS